MKKIFFSSNTSHACERQLSIAKRILLPLMFAMTLFCVQGHAQVLIGAWPSGMVIHSTSGSDMGYWGQNNTTYITYPKSVAPGTSVKMVLEGFGSHLRVQWYVSLLGQEILLNGQTSPTLLHRLDSEANGYTMTYTAVVTNRAMMYPDGSYGTYNYRFSYNVKSKFGKPTLNTESDMNIQVYPNPAVDVLNVKTSSGVANTNTRATSKISLYNEQGGLLKTYSTQDESSQIDLSTYREGRYVLRVQQGAQTISRHIQIKR